ncbi:MAG: nuclear transport factor 2 family protein [Planctomycetota bacterium]
MADVRQQDSRLNEIVKQGKMLEALAEFYDADCTFQEGNADPRRGRQTQHDHLSGFFQTLKAFNGATLHTQGVDGDVSLTEWTFDMVGPDGPILWNEILRRQWRNGKVVSERYYTAG